MEIIIMGKFNYAAIKPGVRESVRAAAERIKAKLKRSAEDVLDIGRELLMVKEEIGHGNFLPWIEAEFEMSQQQANRFMQVAERFGGKLRIMSNLPVTVLYELASPSTSDEAVEEVVEQAKGGKKVTVGDVKKAKAAKPRKSNFSGGARRGSSAILPPAVITATTRPDKTSCSRTRAVLIAVSKAAVKSEHATAWSAWLDGFAKRYFKPHAPNSEYITVGQGFPPGAIAPEFDRNYSKDEAAAFLASLQRANAGAEPLPEDRDPTALATQRHRAKLKEWVDDPEGWRVKKPEEWAPELAKKFGYGTDKYDKGGFAAAYSHQMGHVTVETQSGRELRKRLEAVDATFNALRSMANVKLPSIEDLTVWVHAEGPKDDRKAHWTRRIEEHEVLLSKLKAMLGSVDRKKPAARSKLHLVDAVSP